MRLRAAALPPIVLAVALMAPGACGQSGSSDTSKFSGPSKNVAQRVYDLRDAVAKRDQTKICDTYFTAALRTKLAALAKTDRRGSTCPDQLKDSLQDVDSTDLTVQKVTITGSDATVTYKTNVTSGPDPIDTLHLTNQQGWRVSQLP
ncbi:MAG: hypothetical protein QOF12_920 [Solirubrobacteraceae bacterium]|jgi:hypothetical protein|nr:hypothetical protein [Solirubrobacteraceae bacterium]